MQKQKLINIINILGKFKDLKRTGWLTHKVINPESDAEHSFSLCLLVMLLAPKRLNKQKCMEFALIHDLAEIYTGDYTPEDNIAPEDKYIMEKQSIGRISEEISEPCLIELFDEYQQQKSREAVFVKFLDKIDTVMTAYYYDQTNRATSKLFPEFMSYAKKYIQKQQDSNEELHNIIDILSE